MGRAWGRFKQSNVIASTTIDCVCRACNQGFGDSFELRTARGTYDGLQRYQEGVAPDVDQILYDRITLRVQEPSPWAGVLVRLMRLPDQQGGPFVGLVPQISLRPHGGKAWHSLALVTLERATDPAALMPDFVKSVKCEYWVLADSDEDVEKGKKMLAQLVPAFKDTGNVPADVMKGDTVMIEIQSRLDDDLRRTVAKFAFNFLASRMGAAFVLREDFDEISRYVARGEGHGRSLVVLSEQPLLAEETDRIKLHTGHFLATEWNRSNDAIIGRVALFNANHYAVRLARRYRGIWLPDVRGGICLDPGTGDVKALHCTNLVVPRSPLWAYQP